MWRVALEGNGTDIDDIARAMPTGSPFRVVTVAEHRCLSGELLDRAPTAHAALMAARKSVDVLNVAAWLADSAHGSVRAGAVLDDDGRPYVFAEAGVALSGVRAFGAGVAGDPSDPVPPRERTLAQLIFDLDDMAEVVDVVGLLRGDLSPVDLYKVVEVIEHHVGKPLNEMRWVSSRDRRRFRLSMNHPAVLGRLARHARLPGPTRFRKKKTMDLGQAQAFVGRVVVNWVRWSAVTHGFPLTD